VWPAAPLDGVTIPTPPRRVPQHIDTPVMDNMQKSFSRPELKIPCFRMCHALGLRLCEPAIGS